jgi:chromosome segregation ATPase
MQAMSDDYQREQREFKLKLRESQRQSEQAKANANEMSKLLEESRRKEEEARKRERESETKRTYLETKFQNYIQGTGQSESDTRSNFEAEMNKLKDELETMRAIANANLQSQNIPDPPASFNTSLQGASASRQTASILKQTN